MKSIYAKELKEIRIGLAPFGRIQDFILQSLAGFIRGYCGLGAVILAASPIPAAAYDEKRDQYNAAAIIKALEAMPFDSNLTKVVGIFNTDLFIPIFTHVLGEAREGGRYAVASLYRLSRSAEGLYAPASKVGERLVKVAVHELGHLFDIGHCMDRRCMMHYSGGLQELDAITLTLCSYCAEYLRYAIQRESRVPIKPSTEGP